MRVRAYAAGFLIAFALGAGIGCRSCNEMGCTDLLRVTSHGLRAGQTLEVCTVDACVLAAPAGGTTFADIATPPGKVAEVVLRVHENGVLTLEQRRDQPVGSFRPNGGGCPPECKVVEIVVDERGFA